MDSQYDENNDIKERKYSVLDNSYKTAEKLKGDEFEFGVIKVDDESANVYMKDSCNSDSILFTRMMNYAHQLIIDSPKIQAIMDYYEKNDIKRVSPDDINTLFEFFYNNFNESKDFKNFLNISYVVEIVSTATNTTYDFIFSSLTYENKVIIIDYVSSDTDLIF